MENITSLLDTYGIGLLFAIILLKEIGLPLPIPGDLLMLFAGARAAAGFLPIWAVLLAAVAAGMLGASVQFLLARGPGRGFIYRFGRYVGLTPARLDKASAAVRGRGWSSVALGRALPGLRIGVVAACGLAAVPLPTFLVGLFAGTVLFVGFHTMLGFLAGPGVAAILDNINIPVLPVLLALALVGLIAWLLIRRSRKKDDGISAVVDWTDACCPVCLAAAGIERQLAAGRSKGAAVT
jgi:membrane protein DedA with SNARE-associated domain